MTQMLASMARAACLSSPLRLGDLATWRYVLAVDPVDVRDPVALARRYPRHGGIILAAQSSWMVSELTATLDRVLCHVPI